LVAEQKRAKEEIAAKREEANAEEKLAEQKRSKRGAGR
jgi:hypothetical protein